jgi:hypothetical protein|tara:strand:- start:1332 stop:1445 length:114 start_codon:yes stop_codon:yes gene_type:complete
MVQRLAEKYVGELSEMAKNSNLVTLQLTLAQTPTLGP